MRIRHLAAAVALMLFSFISASAAPKIDRELTARLAVAQPTTQFGVILTFYGDRITQANIAVVQALGIRSGVRMANFPIIGVPATRCNVRWARASAKK